MDKVAERDLRDIGVLTLIEHVFEVNWDRLSYGFNTHVYFYFKSVIPARCRLRKADWYRFDPSYVRKCLAALSGGNTRGFSGLLTVDEVKKNRRGVWYIQLDKKVMIFPDKSVMDLTEKDWGRIVDGVAFGFSLPYMKEVYGGRKSGLVFSFALDPDGDKRGVRNLWSLP